MQDRPPLERVLDLVKDLRGAIPGAQRLGFEERFVGAHGCKFGIGQPDAEVAEATQSAQKEYQLYWFLFAPSALLLRFLR